MTTLTFIHTVSSLRPTFETLARDADPSLEIRHLTDESLLADAIEAGSVPQQTSERLTERVRSALDDGADLVVVTCSSMGGATEAIAKREGWPLERIDVAMADRAIDLGARIAVLATLPSALAPTAALVEARAAERGADIALVRGLATGAFAALQAGDGERHDELVRGAFRDVLGRVDVIVLAQASMGRVVDSLGEEAAGTPILVSPALGVERVVERLRSEHGAEASSS
ncbi:MAG TPA: aspartate/glutamate racemase family protein [Candidatus Limnocylindrales bacterium]|jgi:Asp/Glu/hydantoin racemase|nr:aspartate/glutamate racemase family protein [Candidatus Limnocylindrales bacterium]